MTTYSVNIGLIEPTPNDPAVANVWGGLLNTNQTLIDSALGGTLTLSVAGASNVVLTSTNGAADQSRNTNFVFTGILTGNITVFWPNGSGRRATVKNSTTGAFTLTLAVSNGASPPVAAGTTYALPQGETATVVSDGTNIALATTPLGIGSTPSAIGAVPVARTLTAGSGLTGGGDLSADRTVALATVADKTMLANTSGGVAAPVPTALSAMIDASIGSTRGGILERGATGWSLLTPGTSGYAVTSNGPGADLTYVDPKSGTLLTANNLNEISAAGALARSTARGNLGFTIQKFGGQNLSSSFGSWFHGLGAIPYLLFPFIQCVVADLGYSAGDVVVLPPHGQSNSDGIVVWGDASNVGWLVGSTGSVVILDKGTHVAGFITRGNWNILANGLWTS